MAFLLIQHLAGRGNGRRRRKAVARPGDKRVSYDIGVLLTPEQKEQLKAKARDQVRSVSSYVARVIVEELGRG